jgi:Cysteine-rich CWC
MTAATPLASPGKPGKPDKPDICPRCGGGFACGMQGATPCPCTTVKLDDATLAALRQQYAACLCLRCLQQLAATL